MLVSPLQLLMHLLASKTPPSLISIRNIHTAPAETLLRPVQVLVRFLLTLFCSVLSQYTSNLKFVCGDGWSLSRGFVKTCAHLTIITWCFLLGGPIDVALMSHSNSTSNTINTNTTNAAATTTATAAVAVLPSDDVEQVLVELQRRKNSHEGTLLVELKCFHGHWYVLCLQYSCKPCRLYIS